MANIELLAVNAVSDLIAKCSLLDANIASNDKTPITDGHVDLYADMHHNNSTLLGRVSVQVKGRSTNSKKQTPTFSIDRDTLKFFRTNGGGVYFYVQVRKDLASRVVFFINLNPFRIDRMLNRDAKRVSYSVPFQKLPEDTARIERIFALALEQQKQGKTEGVDERLLEGMRSITIHSVDEISPDRPTVLNLEEDDFAVTIETDGGLKIPFDMDLRISPSSFVPQEIDTTVQCGIAEYFGPTVWQSDGGMTNLRLSDGLLIRARTVDSVMKASIDLTLQGSFQSQLRDLDFVLAAVRGEPLIVGGTSHEALKPTSAREGELTIMRERIRCLIELLDALGANEELVGSTSWSDEDKSTLLTLHRAIVLDEEVAATSDGYGRLDIPVGPFKIVTVVSPGSTPERLRITNPFDPAKRSRFRLFQTTEEGSTEEKVDITVYEPLQATELPEILGIAPTAIVEAYERLEDRSVALSVANQMVLRLLSAADSVVGPNRKRLLTSAGALCDWLVEESDDELLSKINSWQTRHRLGALSFDDIREVRAERRALQRQDGHDARVREACLSILLNDFDELDVILHGLDNEQVDQLQGWPIWTLRTTERLDSTIDPNV